MLMAACVAGCDAIEQRKLAKRCAFSLEKVEIRDLSLSDMTIGLTIAISNPNPKEVIIDRMDLYFYIEDRKTINVRINEVKIPPAGLKTVDASVSMPYATLGMSLPGAMKDTGVIRYRLAGTLFMKTQAGEMRFPVTVYRNQQEVRND